MPIDTQPTLSSFMRAFSVRWDIRLNAFVSIIFAITALCVHHDVAKIMFAGVAFVCGGFASFQLWKLEREKVITLQNQLDTAEQREYAMHRLGEFITKGMELIHRCANKSQPAPEEEGNNWLNNLHKFLTDTPCLGAAYAVRLNKYDGFPFMPPDTHMEMHQKIELEVSVRLAHIHEFLQELSAK